MLKNPMPSISGLYLPASLIMAFGFLMQRHEVAAFVLLALAFLSIFLTLMKMPLGGIFRLFAFSSCHSKWMYTGILMGIALASYLRWVQDRPLYPWPLQSFLFTAMLIGLCEELIFRGYFYAQLAQGAGPPLAIPLSALIHAGYKILLFIPAPANVDLVRLGLLTFIVGLLMAYSRKALGSIWFAAVAHMAFDFWVYGDRLTPWWVWS